MRPGLAETNDPKNSGTRGKGSQPHGEYVRAFHHSPPSLPLFSVFAPSIPLSTHPSNPSIHSILPFIAQFNLASKLTSFYSSGQRTRFNSAPSPTLPSTPPRLHHDQRTPNRSSPTHNPTNHPKPPPIQPIFSSRRPTPCAHPIPRCQERQTRASHRILDTFIPD